MRDVRSCAYNPLCVSKLWVHSSVCVSFKKPESMCPCVLFTVDVLHCGEDVLCVEFIFHWELLVQIRAAEIINERERVQQGEERPRKGYIEEREHRGRKGWSGRVPLESFSLLAGLNRRLWVRKTHTLALFFHLLSITCPPTTSSHSSLSVFFTFSTPSSSVQSIPYFIFSTFPSPILGLIWPFSPGHSLTTPPFILLACPHSERLVSRLICWIIPKHPLSLSSPLNPSLPASFLLFTSQVDPLFSFLQLFGSTHVSFQSAEFRSPSKSSSSLSFFFSSSKHALTLHHFLQISPRLFSFCLFVCFPFPPSPFSSLCPSFHPFSSTLPPANLFLRLQTLNQALSFPYISSVSPHFPLPFLKRPFFIPNPTWPSILPPFSSKKHSKLLPSIRYGPRIHLLLSVYKSA